MFRTAFGKNQLPAASCARVSRRQDRRRYRGCRAHQDPSATGESLPCGRYDRKRWLRSSVAWAVRNSKTRKLRPAASSTLPLPISFSFSFSLPLPLPPGSNPARLRKDIPAYALTTPCGISARVLGRRGDSCVFPYSAQRNCRSKPQSLRRSRLCRRKAGPWPGGRSCPWDP